jgi:hypothetical protein
LGSFGHAVSEENIFKTRPVPIRLQTWPPQAILVSDWLISKKISPLKPLSQMNQNLYASYQVSVHLAKRFQRRFLKIGQSETRIACGSHVWSWIGTKCAFFREDLPSRSMTKHGCHRQFLFLIGRFLRIFSETA